MKENQLPYLETPVLKAIADDRLFLATGSFLLEGFSVSSKTNDLGQFSEQVVRQAGTLLMIIIFGKMANFNRTLGSQSVQNIILAG